MDMLGRWPLVYVEWLDHDADGAWTGEDDVDGDLTTVGSVGWLFRENADVLILIGNQDPANKNIGNKQRILKKLITKTTILRKAKEAKRARRKKDPTDSAKDARGLQPQRAGDAGDKGPVALDSGVAKPRPDKA